MPEIFIFQIPRNVVDRILTSCWATLYELSMYVYAKKKEESRWQVQILESLRVGQKVVQKTVRNIGVAHSPAELEDFKKIAEAAIVTIKNKLKPVLSIFDPFDFHRPKHRASIEDGARVKNLRHLKTFNDGIIDVFGKAYDDLGLSQVIIDTNKDEQWNKILKANVIARIARPLSKLSSHRFLERTFSFEFPLEKTYRMMDHLHEHEKKVKQKVKQATLSLFKEQVDVLFFDVTTLYFESFVADELRSNGFSKDCKFKETQIVLALVTTKDGLPITYKVFPGNTFEGHTLKQMVIELKEEFQIDHFVIVADRGMFSEENLQLMESLKVKYIVAAKLRSLSQAKKTEILDNKNFRLSVVCDEVHWVNNFSHKGRRLIVSYSTKRAKKDRSDRLKLIERLNKKVKNATVKIADIIPNQGTKKFLKITGGIASIDYEKIEKDAQWDGLHGLCTNSTDDINAIMERYRDLWCIEAAFRLQKHSLAMRPVYHWTKDRIEAHILLCFVSYAVAKHVLFLLSQKEINLSLERVREELLEVESMIYQEVVSEKKYVIPSATNHHQKIIYKSIGINRDIQPYSA